MSTKSLDQSCINNKYRSLILKRVFIRNSIHIFKTDLEESQQGNSSRGHRGNNSRSTAEGGVGQRLRGRGSLTNVVQRSDVHGGVELLVLRARGQTVGLSQVEGETLASAEAVESLPFDFDGGAEHELSVGINVDGEQVVGG